MVINFCRKRGLRSRVNVTMFCITWFMFLLSTTYWAYSIAYVVDKIQTMGVIEPVVVGTFHDRVTKYSPLFNALVLINVCHLFLKNPCNQLTASLSVRTYWRRRCLACLASMYSRKKKLHGHPHLLLNIDDQYVHLIFISDAYPEGPLLNIVSVSTTIAFKIASLIIYPVTDAPNGSVLFNGINIVQIANLVMSFLSNVSSTSIIGSTAWFVN